MFQVNKYHLYSFIGSWGCPRCLGASSSVPPQNTVGNRRTPLINCASCCWTLQVKLKLWVKTGLSSALHGYLFIYLLNILIKHWWTLLKPAHFQTPPADSLSLSLIIYSVSISCCAKMWICAPSAANHQETKAEEIRQQGFQPDQYIYRCI